MRAGCLPTGTAAPTTEPVASCHHPVCVEPERRNGIGSPQHLPSPSYPVPPQSLLVVAMLRDVHTLEGALQQIGVGDKNGKTVYSLSYFQRY